MGYEIKISSYVDNKFLILSKKDKNQLNKISKKLAHIAKNPYHFEPLRGDKHGARKARVGKYRIIYEIKESQNIVLILDYGHRKEIYG